jgi:hypothetical protein
MLAFFIAMTAPGSGPCFSDDPSALPGVTTTCGTRAKDYILEVNGGGLALADFDGDLDLDLVVVDGSTLERVSKGEPGFPPRLFLNDGSGHFQAAPEEWKMAASRWGMGCAVGDVDGDGWLDIAITNWGANQLFLSRAGKGWRDTSSSAGFEGARWATSAAFLDYDRDGALDLAVIDYLAFDPNSVASAGRRLHVEGHAGDVRARGPGPGARPALPRQGRRHLRRATVAAKFRPPEAPTGSGVMTLDYDSDGDTDLYVANDSTPNFTVGEPGRRHLPRGRSAARREPRHQRQGASRHGHRLRRSRRRRAPGSVRHQLLRREQLALRVALRQELRRAFRSERTRRTQHPMLGWGTALVDFDLDGDLDASVMNGHVYPQADRPGTDTKYAQPMQLYRNDGTGKFAPERLCDGPERVMRASSYGDIDGDGDVDLVAIELDGAGARAPQHHALGEGGRSAALVARRAALEERQPLRARRPRRSRVGGRQALGGDPHSGGFQSSVPPEGTFRPRKLGAGEASACALAVGARARAHRRRRGSLARARRAGGQVIALLAWLALAAAAAVAARSRRGRVRAGARSGLAAEAAAERWKDLNPKEPVPDALRPRFDLALRAYRRASTDCRSSSCTSSCASNPDFPAALYQ